MPEGGFGQQVVHEHQGEKDQSLGRDRDGGVGAGMMWLLAVEEDHVRVLQDGEEQQAAQGREHVGEKDLAGVHRHGHSRATLLDCHFRLLELHRRLGARHGARAR